MQDNKAHNLQQRENEKQYFRCNDQKLWSAVIQKLPPPTTPQPPTPPKKKL